MSLWPRLKTSSKTSQKTEGDEAEKLIKPPNAARDKRT